MSSSRTAGHAAYPRQTSPVTCGIAALAAVAGRHRFPQYLAAQPLEAATVQERLHAIASRIGMPWPRALGTSPWALAALASSLIGQHFQIIPVLCGGKAREALAHAIDADSDCFLYVGGNAKAWQRWVPRHVVAVLGAESTLTTIWVFEPSSGGIFEVPFASLFDQTRRGPRPEFGRWWTALLAVVPVGDSST